VPVTYSVNVTERTPGTWCVRCFGLPDDGSAGHTVFEEHYRSEQKARKKAKEIAAKWKATYDKGG